MPTRANRFYNNPQFAQIASNLSGLFAPPDPRDELAYAQLDAQRVEQQRLSDLWRQAEGDPDRQGVVAGLYTPNQSMTAVGMRDATTQRGQDMASADRRYGTEVGAQVDMRGQDMTSADRRYSTDVGAQTSVGNNIRDNQYGLAEALATQVVGQGEYAAGTSILDDDIARAAGLAPGTTIEGRAKPLSSDQVVAGAMQDELGRDPTFGTELAWRGVDVAEVIGLDGEAVYAPQGQAARLGLPVAQNAGSRAGMQPIEYTSGGQQLAGSYDPNSGQYVDAAGQPLPADASSITELGQLQGDRAGLGQTSVNAADQRYIASVEAIDLIDDLEQTLRDNPGASGVAGGVQRMSQNLVASVDELSQAFGGRTPTFEEIMQSDAGGIVDETGADVSAQYFNPALNESQMLTNQLVWAYAAAQQGSGRVSNQQMEWAQSALGLNGPLSNNQQIMAAANKLREYYSQKIARDGQLASPDIVNAYRPAAPQAAPTTPAAPQTGGMDDAALFQKYGLQ